MANETTVVEATTVNDREPQDKAKRAIKDAARGFFRGLYHDQKLVISSLGKTKGVTADFRLHITALFPTVTNEYGKGTGGLAGRVIDWIMEAKSVSDADAFGKFRMGANEVRRALLGYMDDEPEIVFYYRLEASDEADFPHTFWATEEIAAADNANVDAPTWERLRKLRNHGNGSATEATTE